MRTFLADIVAAWHAAVETFRSRRYWRARGLNVDLGF